MVIKKPIILSIFGTRPEAIKLAPVINHLITGQSELVSKVVTTAQHRSMLDQMLNHFGIIPDIDLNLMKPDQTLEMLTVHALEKISLVIKKIKPSMILVQGDTTSSFVGALAGFYQKIPVGHIEAGLRTHDLYNPFPEEANRRLISVLAHWHFAATAGAKQKLLNEGVPDKRILITGNTVVDALYQTIDASFDLSRWIKVKESFIIVTMHRRESFGEAFNNILQAIATLAALKPDLTIIFPVHPNPAVKKAVNRIFKIIPKNLCLLAPMDYNVFANLMAKARLVITDSGGIQEEATALGLPVMVCRQVTERPEALMAGAVLVGTDKENIVSQVMKQLDSPKRKKGQKCPFGDGKAAKRIVDALLWIHGKKSRRPETFIC